MKQANRKVIESAVIIAGLLLFALFIHHDNALRIFGFTGLVLSAFAIHYASRGSSLLKITGIVSDTRKLPAYLLIALIIGTAKER